MSVSKVKVFGIGFHKTGTSSLGAALRHLGYSVSGPDLQLLQNMKAKDYSEIIEYACQYDAFEDNPWPILYKEMDQAFPGSKFILTCRDPDEWLRSMINYFAEDTTDMRKHIYGDECGAPIGCEKIYKERYIKHYAEVGEYFSNRKDSLLRIDTKELAWEPICKFLGESTVPTCEFPRFNISTYSFLGKKVAKAKQYIKQRL